MHQRRVLTHCCFQAALMHLVCYHVLHELSASPDAFWDLTRAACRAHAIHDSATHSAQSGGGAASAAAAQPKRAAVAVAMREARVLPAVLRVAAARLEAARYRARVLAPAMAQLAQGSLRAISALPAARLQGGGAAATAEGAADALLQVAHLAARLFFQPVVVAAHGGPPSAVCMAMSVLAEEVGRGAACWCLVEHLWRPEWLAAVAVASGQQAYVSKRDVR